MRWIGCTIPPCADIAEVESELAAFTALPRQANIAALEQAEWRGRRGVRLAFETCDGGCAADHCGSLGGFAPLTEGRVGEIIAHALCGVAHAHAHGVALGCISPFNLVFRAWTEGAQLALVGWTPLGELTTSSRAGLECVAPELLDAHVARYSPPSTMRTAAGDMWSIGVTAAILLTGVHPIVEGDGSSGAKPRPALAVANAVQRYARRGGGPLRLNGISSAAVDFITLLLAVDPRRRLTASDGLHHPFLTRAYRRTAPLAESVRRCIERYARERPARVAPPLPALERERSRGAPESVEIHPLAPPLPPPPPATAPPEWARTAATVPLPAPARTFIAAPPAPTRAATTIAAVDIAQAEVDDIDREIAAATAELSLLSTSTVQQQQQQQQQGQGQRWRQQKRQQQEPPPRQPQPEPQLTQSMQLTRQSRNARAGRDGAQRLPVGVGRGSGRSESGNGGRGGARYGARAEPKKPLQAIPSTQRRPVPNIQQLPKNVQPKPKSKLKTSSAFETLIEDELPSWHSKSARPEPRLETSVVYNDATKLVAATSVSSSTDAPTQVALEESEMLEQDVGGVAEEEQDAYEVALQKAAAAEEALLASSARTLLLLEAPDAPVLAATAFTKVVENPVAGSEARAKEGLEDEAAATDASAPLISSGGVFEDDDDLAALNDIIRQMEEASTAPAPALASPEEGVVEEEEDVLLPGEEGYVMRPAEELPTTAEPQLDVAIFTTASPPRPTGPYPSPGAPVLVHAGAATLSVEWTPPLVLGARRSADATVHYEVWFRSAFASAFSCTELGVLAPTQLSHTLKFLTPRCHYTIALRASADGLEWSSFSPLGEFKTIAMVENELLEVVKEKSGEVARASELPVTTVLAAEEEVEVEEEEDERKEAEEKESLTTMAVVVAAWTQTPPRVVGSAEGEITVAWEACRQSSSAKSATEASTAVEYELEWHVDGDEPRAASAGMGLSAIIEDLPRSCRFYIIVRACDVASGAVLATSAAAEMSTAGATATMKATLEAASTASAAPSASASSPPASALPAARRRQPQPRAVAAARETGLALPDLRYDVAALRSNSVGGRDMEERSGSLWIGARVRLRKSGAEGIVTYEGNCHFKPGRWIGIVLIDGSLGKHDGVVDGVRYFTTTRRAKTGLFVRSAALDLLPQ